jgi:hypothetical protein
VGGLIWTFVLADLALRLIARTRVSRSTGTLFLLISLTITAGALLQYPGKLLAGPSQDAAGLLLGLAATAALADAVSGVRVRLSGTLAVLIAALSATFRPLNWVFVLAIALVVASVFARRLHWQRCGRPTTVALIGSAAVMIVMLVRDALLSGWLLFPVALFPVPVDWRTRDPGIASDGITAWARTPFQDVQVTLADDSWILGWAQRMLLDWAVLAMIALLLLTVVGLLLGQRDARLQRRWKSERGRLLLALIPTITMLIVWFPTAPDPRFAWTAILTLGALPAAWLLQAMVATNVLPFAWVVFGSGALIAAFVVLGLLRSDGQIFVNRSDTIPEAGFQQEQLADGTEVSVVLGGDDRCWRAFPLCIPIYEDRSIGLRGTEISEGFRPQ